MDVEKSEDPDKDQDEMSDDVSSDEDDEQSIDEDVESTTAQDLKDITHQSVDDKGHMEHLESGVQSTSLNAENEQCHLTEHSDKCENEDISGGAKKETLLNGEELIEFLCSLQTGSKVTEGITTIGLVGTLNFNCNRSLWLIFFFQ